jgi:hypothetical protein
MNWYYAEDGQQRGPVSEVEITALAQAGTITDTSLVWKEDMTEWRAYGEVKGQIGMRPAESAAVPPIAAGAEAVCAECGRTLPKEQTVAFGAVSICAQCKPAYIQKLREGVAPTGRSGRRPLPVNPDQLLQEVLSREFEVDIGRCVGRAWEAVKANFWLAVGTTFLVVLCMQACGIIPFVGVCLSMVFSGPLIGGLYLFLLKLVRGEPASVGDGFTGFSKLFGPLLAAFILMCLCIYAPLLPCVIYAVATKQLAGASPSPDAIFFGLAVVGVLGAVYLGMALSMALPLVADLELGPIHALRISWRVVSRKWFSFFGLGLVCGLIILLGLLALCVGLFVAMPVTYAAWMCAYEDVFGAGPGGAGS